MKDEFQPGSGWAHSPAVNAPPPMKKLAKAVKGQRTPKDYDMDAAPLYKFKNLWHSDAGGVPCKSSTSAAASGGFIG